MHKRTSQITSKRKYVKKHFLHKAVHHDQQHQRKMNGMSKSVWESRGTCHCLWIHQQPEKQEKPVQAEMHIFISHKRLVKVNKRNAP